MNNLDARYQALLEDILHWGVEKSDRTGTGTISVFGRQIRHKMSEGFPLLTTKKMPFKTIVTELLWFLRGDTNIKYLVDNGCHIWDGDCYKRYYTEWSKSVPGDGTFSSNEYSSPSKYEACNFTKEEFIHKIKTDDEFANKWGELGPIYGKQWRDWENYNGLHLDESIDQIQNLINELKTNPDSRRLMVNAWNVGELDQMVLPPCHYGFQVYTRELSQEERFKIAYKNLELRKKLESESAMLHYPSGHSKVMDDANIPTRAISLMWNQRSVDTFLGLPFNIASYGLLLEILAKEVNMIPDELIGNLGDVHLYNNHIEQAKEQIGRRYSYDERHEMLKESIGYQNYHDVVNEFMPFGGGISEYYEIHKIPTHSREPFGLPTLKILDSNVDDIAHYEIADFEIKDYQSHPSIKAPLSN
jgi:thymidylate synthase